MDKENIRFDKLQKKHDELTQNHKELLDTQKLKDDLMVMLVHDFKSPLTSLMEHLKACYHETNNLLKQLLNDKNQSKMLSLDQSNSFLNKQLKYLFSANSDAQLLWRRVTNLLDIQKIQENQMHLELEEFNIKSLLEEAVAEMEMMANDQQVNLTAENLSNTELVYSDYDLIVRVLTNLLSNAIKHSGPEQGGKGKVKLTARDDDKYLKFEVLDSGPGIPEDFKKHLFSKYTQLKRIKGSTGLGLTFSKLAVESLQGQINSKNINNNGALFYFSIPKRYEQKNSTKENFDENKWQFN